MRLRRTAILRLLQSWAQEHDLALLDIPAIEPGAECELPSNCRMVIVSIGASSVAEIVPNSLLHSTAQSRAVPLVILSDREDAEDVTAAITAGARGYLPSSMDPKVALAALTFILDGGWVFPPTAFSAASRAPAGHQDGSTLEQINRSSLTVQRLTLRQAEVVELLRKGLPNKVIANRLKTTEATVKAHVREIMHKFGAANRTQAAMIAINTETRGGKPS